MSRESLLNKTAKGVAWSAVEHFSVKGINFLVTLVMARLLLPSDYGLLGLLGVFMSLSCVMIDGGVWQAIVRNHQRTETDFTTMFCFNFAVSLFAYLILFLIAPYVANFFGYPELCLIMRVLSLNLVISSLAIVQRVHLYIELNFRRLARITVMSSILSGILGIMLAYSGMGVWALVWQQIFSSVVTILLLLWSVRWFPNAPFSFQSLRNMFGFGSKLALTQLINIIYFDMGNLAIGKFYSPTNLGLYTRAYHFAVFPTNSFIGVFDRVTYPVFCRMEDDERLKNAFKRYLGVSTFIIFPLMLLMAALSKPLIDVLLGEKWVFSAELIPLLCFALMWLPITRANISVIKVKGRSDLCLRLEIIKKGLGICLLCASVPLGLKAICATTIVTYVVSALLDMLYTRKVIDISIKEQVRCVAPSLLLSIVISAVVYLLTLIISNNFLGIIMGVAVAALIFFSIAKIFRMHEFTDLCLTLKSFKHES